MDIKEAIRSRHSVRAYTDQPIEGEILSQLQQMIQECNEESGLHIQLLVNEPSAFTGMMARYGKFENVKNYIALVADKQQDAEEKCGYYGEKIVLHAQQLGLNTCWVALSFSKGKAKSAITINSGEKLMMVISLGYGANQGVVHKNKPIEAISRMQEMEPQWFRQGMDAVLLSPTAMNQQKFYFEQTGNKVKATAGSGFHTKVDLGIAKYHFEVGAGEADWEWQK